MSRRPNPRSTRAAPAAGARAALPPLVLAPVPRALSIGVALALGAFLGLQYAGALRGPFMADDYLFLTRVRDASLATLLSANTIVAHYYRPWSRELHYWALQRLFGPNEAIFHAVNLLLALAAMWLFFRLASRVAGARAAVIATAGIALAAGWGTLMGWVAGCQDLWMMALGLAYLNLAIAGRRPAALVCLALALLSKETAAVLPAVALLHAVLVARRPLREALRGAGGDLLMLAAWLALHPMFGGRLLAAHGAASGEASSAIDPVNLVWAVLSLANVDVPPVPEHGLAGVLPACWPGAVLLPLGLAWALRSSRGATRGAPAAARASRSRIALWGAAWAALGMLPLLMPGLLWQPYYFLLGSFGAWLAIAVWLERWPTLAIVLLVALGVLRTTRAQTPQARMGNEWTQARMATLTRRMRDDLRRLHPTLPPHARIFFGEAPWGLGLITGHPDSPALRVWYGDTTLSGGYYSDYAARPTSMPPGRDFVFLFDSDGHVREVVVGPEPAGTPRDTIWEKDHAHLAVRFARAHDLAASEGEWRKLVAAFPHRFEYAYNLGESFAQAGQPESAAVWRAKSEALKRSAPAGN
jgi:hypothetical protein